jgi:hypothetical protein
MLITIKFYHFHPHVNKCEKKDILTFFIVINKLTGPITITIFTIFIYILYS